MRTCTRCKQEKPEGSFYKVKASKSGFDSWCKQCKNKASLEWSKKNPERSKETMGRILKEKQRKRRVVMDTLKNVPCADCSNSYPPYCMDFDHIPERGEKLGAVATMWSYGEETFLAEIAKCDIVCSNCHRSRTHNRRVKTSDAQPNSGRT